MADLTVTATFDKIGIEDLSLGQGTFTRSTSTGGTQEITKINSETLGFALPSTPEDYGAVGDGTDDSVALQALFDAGGSIYIPNKTYMSSKGPLILSSDGAKVVCHGTIKLINGATRWPQDGEGQAATSVVNIRDCKDVTWSGGILDGNGQAVNGMAINHDLIFRNEVGAYAYRVYLNDLIVRNCYHDVDSDPGGATPHSGGIGNGGGKGVTFQFGGPQVIATGLRIHDCTIGISYEGGVSNETSYPDLIVSNSTVRGCTVGLLCRGVYGATGGDDLGGDHYSSLWNNIAFINCGTDTVPDTLSDVDINPTDFGVIDAVKCVNMSMTNFKIRNQTGPMTPFRGQFRNCNFQGEIDVKKVDYLFNFSRNLNGYGSGDGESPTRHCSFHVRAKLRGAGVSGDQITTAYITDAGSTGSYNIDDCYFNLSLMVGDGANDFTGNFSQITADFYTNDDGDDLPSSVSYKLLDLGSGKWCEGHGVVRNESDHHLNGQTPTMSSTTYGLFNNNNLTWENDVQAGIVRVRSADATGKVGLGNNAGSTVCYADTLGLVVGDGTWNGRHLILGGYHLWVYADDLYIKSSAPTSATDGTIVGTQS